MYQVILIVFLFFCYKEVIRELMNSHVLSHWVFSYILYYVIDE